MAVSFSRQGPIVEADLKKVFGVGLALPPDAVGQYVGHIWQHFDQHHHFIEVIHIIRRQKRVGIDQSPFHLLAPDLDDTAG